MQPKAIHQWAYIPTSYDAETTRWVRIYKNNAKWLLVNKRGHLTEMRGTGTWIRNSIPACYLDNEDNYEGDTND